MHCIFSGRYVGSVVQMLEVDSFHSENKIKININIIIILLRGYVVSG